MGSRGEATEGERKRVSKGVRVNMCSVTMSEYRERGSIREHERHRDRETKKGFD